MYPEFFSVVSWSAGVWAFLEYMDMHAMMFGTTPGPSRDRGEMAMAGLRRSSASFHALHQTVSLGPCTDAVHGAPGHNRW